MSRTLYLVCYDISSPGRLRRVHRCVAAYAIGGQKSFYECWMTDADRHNLVGELKRLIDPKNDSIHFFQLDPRIDPMFFGTANRQSFQPFLIV